MEKYIIFLILCLFPCVLRADTVVVVGKPLSGYTLQQDLPATKDNNAARALGSGSIDVYVGGSFTASANYTCTKIEFYVDSITGDPSARTYTGYLYSNGTNEPGSALETATATISGADIVAGYNAFTFAGEALASGTTYWFVIKVDQAAAAYISIRYDSTDAKIVVRGDSTPTWTASDVSSQICIKVYNGGV